MGVQVRLRRDRDAPSRSAQPPLAVRPNPDCFLGFHLDCFNGLLVYHPIICSSNGLARDTLAGRTGTDVLQMVHPHPAQITALGLLCVSSRLNTKLELNGYPPMSSLVRDLSDGVRLIQLMVSERF